LVWLFKGDAALRALTASSYGWAPSHEASGEGWQAAFLAQLLDDPYSAVRYIAFRSLRTYPGFEDIQFERIDSAELRRQAAHDVLLRWNRMTDKVPPADPTKVLLDAHGVPRAEDIRELLRQRDNRPIEFPE
jgi:hypothetical protein